MTDSIKPFERQGNFTQIDNVVFDEIMPRLKPTSFKVLMAILRKTIGWQKQDDYISISQLMSATGIKSNNTILAGIAELEKYKIVIKRTGDISTPNHFAINREFDLVQFLAYFKKCTTPSAKIAQPPSAKNAHTKESLVNKVNTKEAGKPPTPKKPSSPSQKPAAVHVYHGIANRYPPKQVWALLDEAIGDDPADLARWGEVVKAWLLTGWSPQNFNGMLDYFSRGELPGQRKGANYGNATQTNSNGNFNGGHRTQLDADIDAFIAAERARGGKSNITIVGGQNAG